MYGKQHLVHYHHSLSIVHVIIFVYCIFDLTYNMSNQPADLKTSRELQFHVLVSLQAYEAFHVPAIR